MKDDDTYNDTKTNDPATGGNGTDSTKASGYRLLGESGLVEDEDGNIYSASEIDDYDEQQKQESYSPTSAFRNFGVSSVLDDKANPAYWYYYYDERYCGPDREAYMEKMALQYRKAHQGEKKEITPAKTEPAKAPAPADREPVKASTPVKPVSANEVYIAVPKAAKEKADREQKELERDGLRPLWNQHVSGPDFGGIVNRHGEVVISDKEYSLICFFSNGLAVARSRKTKKFGFIDRHGNEVIPCTWRSAGPFSEYMAGVHDNYRRCGYVDVTGRLAIPCTWIEGWPFHEGYARVQGEHKRIGMIDQRGKLVVPCIWIAMGDFSEGLAGVRDDNGKCGYIDKTGKIVIPCRWKQVWTFCEGRAVVQDFNKRLGFIDKSGELVIPCRWKKVNYFHNGLAKVSDSRNFFFQSKWVYIDKQGRIVK